MDGLDEDFARELTKGMESLFRDIAMGAGLDGVPDLGKGAGAEGTTDEEQEKAFRAAWEAMLVEGMNGTMNPEDLIAPPGVGTAKGTGTGNAAASSSGPSGGPPQSFQDNIKRAMDKMKESNQLVSCICIQAAAIVVCA